MKSSLNRLTAVERLGYGLGSTGESAIYILYSFYAMFFLTDVAKVNTVSAGAIISVSTVANALFVIYLGYKSDSCRSKSGRRIPFMRAAILPAALFCIMCFSAVELPQNFKLPYYGAAVLGIIGMHTLFVLPYEALGAEITDNFEDRNSIRNYAKFFMGIGTLLGL
ncbi:MAG TPA: MFS transporter, partial [Candidatus Copromorpha excrementigallinarum]|nr:MFS transporter [Candidatus Copromorpha excrementigallinarum]